MIASDDLTQEQTEASFGASSEVVVSSGVIQVGGPHISGIADVLATARR